MRSRVILVFIIIFFLCPCSSVQAQLASHISISNESENTYGLVSTSFGEIAFGNSEHTFDLFLLDASGELVDQRFVRINPGIGISVHQTSAVIEYEPGVLLICGFVFQGNGVDGGIVFKYDFFTNAVIWVYRSTDILPRSIVKSPVDSAVMVYGQAQGNSGYECNVRFLNPDTGLLISSKQFDWSGSNLTEFHFTLQHNGAIYSASRNNYSGGGTNRMRISLSRISMDGDEEFTFYYVRPISAVGRHYAVQLIEGPTGLTILGQGDLNGTQVGTDMFILEVDDNGVNSKSLMINGPNTIRPQNLFRYSQGYVCTAEIIENGNSDLVIFYVSDNNEIVWAKKGLFAGIETAPLSSNGSAILNGNVLHWSVGSDNYSGTAEKDLLYIQQDITDFNSDCCQLWEDYDGLELTVLNPFDAEVQLNETVPNTSSITGSAAIVLKEIEEEDYCQDPITSLVQTSICEGDSMLYGGVYYDQAGTYSIAMDCDTLFLLDLSILSAPAIELGSDLTICIGEDVELSIPNTFDEILWSTGSDQNAIVIDQNGEYWVQASVNSCMNSDTILVSWNSIFSSVDQNETICMGDSVLFNGEFYSTSGVYSDTLDCSVIHTLYLNTEEEPLLDLGPDIIACSGDQVMLASPFSGSLTWSDGTGEDNLFVMETGLVWLNALIGACAVTDTVFVEFIPEILIDLGPDLTICEGDELELTIPAGFESVEWNTGSVENTIIVDQVGTFWVQVTMNYCMYSDTIQIAWNSDFEIIETSETICQGDSVLFNNEYFSLAGIYTDTMDCTTIHNLILETELAPDLNLGSDIIACSEDIITINSPVSGDLYWSTGSTGNQIVIQSSGTVWLEALMGSCLVSDTIEVELIPELIIDLGEDVFICEGEETILFADFSGGTGSLQDFQWQDGQSSMVYPISEAGTYWFRSNSGPCTSSDTIEVILEEYPEELDFVDFELCAGTSIEVGSFPTDVLVLYEGEDILDMVFSQDESLELEVSNGHCSISDTVNISILQFPDSDLGEDFDLCEGHQRVLMPSFTAQGFTWQDGSIADHFQANDEGYYSYTMVTECGLVGDTILISSIICDSILFIPNAFSPDNDGINDLFRAEGNGIDFFEMTIYDRWGDVVFKSEFIEQTWNGSVLGADYFAQDGIYSYHIRYSYGQTGNSVNIALEEVYGFVLLLR